MFVSPASYFSDGAKYDHPSYISSALGNDEMLSITLYLNPEVSSRTFDNFFPIYSKTEISIFETYSSLFSSLIADCV